MSKATINNLNLIRSRIEREYDFIVGLKAKQVNKRLLRAIIKSTL